MKRLRLLTVLLVCALSIAILLNARKAPASASGCTRHDGAAPGFGECWSLPGSSCYYCEYSEPGGTYACGENEDGSVKRCIPIDYQNW